MAEEEATQTMTRHQRYYALHREEKLNKVKERYKNVHVTSTKLHMNHELINAIELGYMLEEAHTIALGAYLREESRGAHFRRDFSARNDADWLKHTIAKIGPDGEPVISSKKVVITKYQPMERKY